MIGRLADRRGLALLEFALVLPVLLVLIAIVIDLGFCYNARLNALRGITAGALYAFENGGSVTPATAPQLRTTVAAIVTQAAGNQPPEVTVMVNNVAGANAAGDYYCTSGKPTVWRSVGPTRVGCDDDTMAAKFVTIRATRTQTALIPFATLGAHLFPLTETIVVRTK